MRFLPYAEGRPLAQHSGVDIFLALFHAAIFLSAAWWARTDGGDLRLLLVFPPLSSSKSLGRDGGVDLLPAPFRGAVYLSAARWAPAGDGHFRLLLVSLPHPPVAGFGARCAAMGMLKMAWSNQSGGRAD